MILTVTCKRTIFSVEINRSTLNPYRQLSTSVSNLTNLFFELKALFKKNGYISMSTFIAQKSENMSVT